MNESFEKLTDRLTPTLRRIAWKLNGHFSFFDDDDLFQEAMTHLWVLFQEGKLNDKTDSYVLQGCYYHLKNYLRKSIDKAKLMSLNNLINDEEDGLEEVFSLEDRGPSNYQEELVYESLIEAAKANGLTEREKEILTFSLEGLTTREIGSRLGISHVMVIKIRKRLREKLRTIGYQR